MRKDAPGELMGKGKKESQALRPLLDDPGAVCAWGDEDLLPSATR